MGEELENQRQLASNSNQVLPELQLLFTLKPGMDRRRYNFQRINEVAAVFSTNADGEIPESYVTIRNKRTKTLQVVNSMILMLNHGYIHYFIHMKLEDGTQWLVDNYVKIEKDRIDFYKNYQKKLRIETYQGLIDYMQNVTNNSNKRIGKMVVLPSSFIGSPRNMLQNYQDAMAIVTKYGKPDLFITMTCNPNWREIQENLLPGQQPSDRPDICARVFNIKKDYLIDSIVKQKMFGETAAYVYVIEFQKRRLPHIHLLITLKHNFKITIPEVIDKYISAEIPNLYKNRTLHDIVMKHMIHEPCGDWCKKDNRCSKRYPRAFQEETKVDENNYPYYR
ncbi:uncharacterized protein [Cardiocondyla obscurior]|uniref:uncharacterized protein n=1 Tax=Cardiocondyla obscurior TaxID=286306 RepID=UPI00396577E8